MTRESMTILRRDEWGFYDALLINFEYEIVLNFLLWSRNFSGLLLHEPAVCLSSRISGCCPTYGITWLYAW
jgi:hypothetical protein